MLAFLDINDSAFLGAMTGREAKSGKAKGMPSLFWVLIFWAIMVVSVLTFLPFIAINAIYAKARNVVLCHFSRGCICVTYTPKNGRQIPGAMNGFQDPSHYSGKNTHTCN